MSAVLDTILGLAFMFFLVALLCSTAVETWANWVKKRAKFLLRGLGWMVGSSGESRTPSTASAGAAQTGMRASVTRLTDLARGGVAVLGKEAELNDAARAASPAPPSDTPDASVGTPVSSGVMAVMGHPLVDALKTRNALGTKTRNPGRIPTPTLATVLLDLYAAGPSSGLNASSRDALTKLSELAEGRADRLKPLIEEWIDAQMQQVTEAYKRWTKRWLIVIASVVVLGLGIDTVAVMQALYTSEPLRNAVTSAISAGTACNPGSDDDEQTPVKQTTQCVRDHLDGLDAASLPVTWWSQPRETPTSTSDAHNWFAQRHTGTDWLVKILGLLLTIGAAVLGAPFWFDAISRISSLRNSGDQKK